ncbi:MAG: hypothetical protein JXA37_11125 [Chloroflexia bacterium]|nr:hypothetical protein [Chloroflexia bacterium]
MRPLSLVLLFHLNQWLTPFAHLASQVCYRGLLEVLRRHPRLPVALHVSGTLLHSLNWLDPQPLQRIRQGLAAGQFELLGSTYAQNVAYATDDSDNARQLAWHRWILRQHFGVEPSGFWNPERCWRSSLLPLLQQSGYRYTFAEDTLLRGAGVGEPHRVHALRLPAGPPLALLCDDQELKHRFNLAMWLGQREPLLDYLRQLQRDQRDGDWVAVYAEDGEACGLWGYQRGLLPQQQWAGLEALLTALETLPWLRVVLPGQVVGRPHPLDNLPDGQASWMVASLRTPGAPYHEEGYADWFDYAARSPRLTYFGQVYEQVRRRLREVESAVRTPAAGRLLRLAGLAFAAHQYEFGCIGIGRRGSTFWEAVRQALPVIRAAEEADRAAGGPSFWAEDVNADGRAEHLLRDGATLAVLGRGGRLLYAFDLRRGQCWAGNPALAPGWGTWDEHAYPEAAVYPQPWLPPDDRPDLAPFADLAAPGDPRAAWQHMLPEHLWALVPGTVRLHRRPPDGPPRRLPPPAGRRALNETLYADGETLLAPGGWKTGRWEGGALRFAAEAPGLDLEKEARLRDGMLEVVYHLENRGKAIRQLALEVENELCPDALTLLDAGREGVAWWSEAGLTAEATPASRGAFNRRAGLGVRVTARPAPDGVEGQLVLGALLLRYRFSLELAPGQGRQVHLGLAVLGR